MSVVRELSADQIRKEYSLVQVLRFLAALAVVVLHSSFYTAERLASDFGIYAIGANGVRLFFVISGFVMIVSSLRLLTAERAWSVFALKRIVRIVPMYWLITSVKVGALLLVPAVVLHARLDWVYVAKSYFFIPALNADGQPHPLLGVGWTLIFEMLFYFLFTVAIFLRKSPVTVVVPVLITLSLASFFMEPDWPVPAQFWCDPIVLDFVAGMCIGIWALSGKIVAPWVSVSLVFVGFIYLFVPFPHLDYQSFIGSLVTTLAASMVVFGCVALEVKLAARVPRWMLFLGAASYATYLIHPIISPGIPHFFFKLGIVHPAFSILLSTAVALVAGSLMHIYCERPTTSALNTWLIRRRWLNPSRGHSPA